MKPPATDAELREAWTAAVQHRGRAHPVLDRVIEMQAEWAQMPPVERERHRRLAYALLWEIGP